MQVYPRNTALRACDLFNYSRLPRVEEEGNCNHAKVYFPGSSGTMLYNVKDYNLNSTHNDFDQLSSIISTNKLSNKQKKNSLRLFALADCIGAPESTLQLLVPYFFKRLNASECKKPEQTDRIPYLTSIALHYASFERWIEYCKSQPPIWNILYQPSKRTIDISKKTLEQLGLGRTFTTFTQGDLLSLADMINYPERHQIETISISGHHLKEISFKTLFHLFSCLSHIDLSNNAFTMIPKKIAKKHKEQHFSSNNATIAWGDSERINVHFKNNPIALAAFTQLASKHAAIWPRQPCTTRFSCPTIEDKIFCGLTLVLSACLIMWIFAVIDYNLTGKSPFAVSNSTSLIPMNLKSLEDDQIFSNNVSLLYVDLLQSNNTCFSSH